ncbi:MAG: tripartite tricarboxylate transporter substrate binding protein [Casimicrobiaceae bacterium]
MPIKIVVPFAPGTASDLIARVVAQKLSEQLGQQVITENREGAGGVVGTTAVQKSPPDGYTVLMAANPFTASPSTSVTPPYDPIKDFTPVAMVALVPTVLTVSPSVPAKTMKEFIAYVKANPGKLNYASSGKGTPSHVESEVLKETLGLDIVEVQYKSTSQAITDVIADRITMFIPSLPAAQSQINTGKMRALAVYYPHRWPTLPDVPTIAEALEMPDFQVRSVWYGFLVRAGTPAAVVATLNREIVRAVQTPAVREQFAAAGAGVVVQTPEQFTAQIKAEVEFWDKMSVRLKLRE